jgi:hypothetical protein
MGSSSKQFVHGLVDWELAALKIPTKEPIDTSN